MARHLFDRRPSRRDRHRGPTSARSATSPRRSGSSTRAATSTATGSTSPAPSSRGPRRRHATRRGRSVRRRGARRRRTRHRSERPRLAARVRTPRGRRAAHHRLRRARRPPADHVRIGVGAPWSASDAIATVKAHVPLFRAAKLNHAGARPRDPRHRRRRDRARRRDHDQRPDDPVRWPLRLCVPTGSTAAPVLGLSLQGLQLPGAPRPSDLTLSLDDLAALEHDFLDLLVGLVQAQAAALGERPARVVRRAARVARGQRSPAPASPRRARARSARAHRLVRERRSRGDTTRAAWLAELAGPPRRRARRRCGRVRARARAAPRRRPAPIREPPGTRRCRAVRRGRDRRAERRRDRVGRGRSREHRSWHAAPQSALPSCAIARRARPPAGGAGTPLLTGDPAVDRMVVRVPPRPEPQARAAPRRRGASRSAATSTTSSTCRHRTPSRRRRAPSSSHVVDDSDRAARPGRRRGQDAARAVAAAGLPGRSRPSISRTFLQDPLGAVAKLLAHAPRPRTPTRYRRCSTCCAISSSTRARPRPRSAAPAPRPTRGGRRSSAASSCKRGSRMTC